MSLADESLEIEWDKTLGGTREDMGISIVESFDGGYVIVGGTKSYGDEDGHWFAQHGYPAGHKVWDKTFEGSQKYFAWSIEKTLDGGYILVGIIQSFGS